MTDFKTVGFSNPTADLFVYLIHLTTENRRAIEEEFLQTYHKNLLKCKRVYKSYTYERMINDFKMLGFTRFMCYLAGPTYCGDVEEKKLCERVEAFIEDYKIDCENVGPAINAWFGDC